MVDGTIDGNRVLIVGMGFAGQRLLKALRFINASSDWALSFAACDVNCEQTAGLSQDIARFSSLDEACRCFRPDIAVVSVNEVSHFEALQRLAQEPLRLLLCEKPLTQTVEEARRLTALNNVNVSLNLVERFSPICDDFAAWMRARDDLKVVRVESHWGKCRISDPRPTMGVLSEIIHPLDLIDYLFGLRDLRVEQVFAVKSNFNGASSSKLDSLDLVLRSSSFPAVIRSSFVWAKRQRTVSAIFAGSDGARYMAHLEFDNPEWDCDSVEVCRVTDSDAAPKEVIFESKRNNADFPQELFGIFKVTRFVRESLESLNEAETPRRLMDYAGALRLQDWLAAIERESSLRGNIVENWLGGSAATLHRLMPVKTVAASCSRVSVPGSTRASGVSEEVSG